MGMFHWLTGLFACQPALPEAKSGATPQRHVTPDEAWKRREAKRKRKAAKAARRRNRK